MATTQAGRIGVATTDRRDDDIATKPGGVAPASAIVPVERPPVSRVIARHDAFFVTQLIAMAQRSPQTRVLRRAEPQAAHAAYHSTSGQKRDGAQTAARLLRVV
jgi:hypothetical protein